MRMRLGLAGAVVALLWLPFAALADQLQTAPPESVGLSAERLGRITETLRADIAKGTIPGAVLLVSRRGKVAYFEALGTLDPATKAPMTREAIFRIYSMSKPITTVAAMMLVEQGKLALADPVARYIPQFKDVQLGVERTDTAGQKSLELVPSPRAMTVQDLMRHTAGLTYGFFGDGLVKKAYLAADLNKGEFDNAEFADRLAKLPLAYAPGTTWDYSQATDILGRVIEVVSGKSLYQFEKESIFDPLGMTDTSFYVTDPSKHVRIAEPFPPDRVFGADAQMNDPRVARKYESGGGGLVSTAADYARFCQMLLAGGAFEGRRYLSPRTVAYMASDHMGDVIKRGPLDLLGPGYKFGLGFGVRTEPGLAPIAGSPGDYYWGGVGGTYFWIDPREQMYVVFMMQAPSKRAQYRTLLRNMLYAAVID
jgi:CubicO group peptidase (beta-lactamase class C family)